MTLRTSARWISGELGHGNAGEAFILAADFDGIGAFFLAPGAEEGEVALAAVEHLEDVPLARKAWYQ